MPRDPTMRFALPCSGRALAGANARPIVDDDSVLDDAVRRFISGIMNAQPPTRRSQAGPHYVLLLAADSRYAVGCSSPTRISRSACEAGCW